MKKNLRSQWTSYRLASFFLPKYQLLPKTDSTLFNFPAEVSVKVRFAPKVTRLKRGDRPALALASKRLQLLAPKFNLATPKLEKVYFFRDSDAATRRKKRKLAFIARYVSRASGIFQAESVWRLVTLQHTLNPYLLHHYYRFTYTAGLASYGSAVLGSIRGLPAFANYFGGLFAPREKYYVGRLRFKLKFIDAEFGKSFLQNIQDLKNEEI